MTKEQILDKIYMLEHERMEYLEVDDKRNANRKRKEIEKLQNELDLMEARKLINEVKHLKLFIHKKGLNQEYVNFVDKEDK